MRYTYILLATAIASTAVVSFQTYSDALSFASLATTVVVAVYQLRGDLWERLTGIPDLGSLDRIANSVRSVDTSLNSIRDQLDDSVSVQELLRAVSNNIELQMKLQDVTKWINQIDIMYSQMQQYLNHPRKYENATIKNFAETCVSHERDALPGMITSIFDNVVSIGSGDLVHSEVLSILESNLKESSLSSTCKFQQSPHQLLYKLLESIVLTEIKGYATMQYAWIILRILGHGNFSEEVENARIKYENRINSTMAAFKNPLQNANREVLRCDPKNFVEGESFERITNFRQGYIENEVNIGEEWKCDSGCADYKSKNLQKRCVDDTICQKQTSCNGVLNSCINLEGEDDSKMTICQAPKGSNRRYDWIQYENGVVNGAFGKCKSKKLKMHTSWKKLFWQCSYCACICDDKAGPKSDRYFNLNEINANIRDNKVVTGLRFVKVNRVISLQISEGTLLPGGLVDGNTTWSPIANKPFKQQIAGKDYHELSLKERGIDLDDLEGRSGHVLTGVRLKQIKGSLNFQIRTTPFDYKTGKLRRLESIWTYSRKERTQIANNNLDIPTNSRTKSTPDSISGQYIEFDHTDFSIDFAQTTIPFIDIQPVVSASPVLLSGAGLYHKGSVGFGGYIAPKIITYNYAQHINDHFKIPPQA